MQVKEWQRWKKWRKYSILYHSLCLLPSAVFIFFTWLFMRICIFPKSKCIVYPSFLLKSKYYINRPAFNYSYKISLTTHIPLSNFLMLLKADRRRGKNSCWGSQWVTVSHRNGWGHSCCSANNRAAITSKWRMEAAWPLNKEWKMGNIFTHQWRNILPNHGEGGTVYETASINE